jgi:ABC-type phosphate transport system permease subunit
LPPANLVTRRGSLGAALVLVTMVLVINLASRWVLRRQIRLAGEL